MASEVSQSKRRASTTASFKIFADVSWEDAQRDLLELIDKLLQQPMGWMFKEPVADYPGYEDIIPNPMDLGTIKVSWFASQEE